VIRKRRIDLKATMYCMAAVACWTLGPIFIKYLTGYLDVWTQNLLRYIVACLFWLPFLAWGIRQGRVEGSVWKKALVPAAINFVMQSFWVGCFYYLNPAFVELLLQSSVIWIAALSLILFKQERFLLKSRRFWSGIVLCFGGVCGVLIFKEGFASPETLAGVVMVLVAAGLWGIYMVSAKAAFKDIDSRYGF